MYNWVVRRITERTTGPQPVFTTIVDQAVRTWIPATALLLSAFVTPARAKLDVRSYDWAPSSAWMQPAAVDVTVRTWAPAFSTELASARTADRPRVDVRTYDWAPQPAWIFATLTPPATTAQLWPGIEAGTQRSYRTPARSQFDLRYPDWEWDAPYRATVDVSVRAWAPAFSQELAGFRTSERPRLDVRSFEWAPPPAWIFTNLTLPPTTAQTWPAVLSGLPLSYRTDDRARLDVRGHEWSPQFGWVSRVVDSIVASWLPALSHQRRSGDIPLAPRAAAVTTAPDLGWLTTAVTPPLTTAQTFPAQLQSLASFRTADVQRLDVRREDWLRAGWVARTVDAVVAKWLPVWDAEVSYRTPDKPTLDVRSITGEPEMAWLSAVIVFVPPAAVLNASVTSIRSRVPELTITSLSPNRTIEQNE
jgi:hypothetical protein